MQVEEIKTLWEKTYQNIAPQINAFKKVKGVVSAFNTNIDAVIKVSAKNIAHLIEAEGLSLKQIHQNPSPVIQTKADFFRGLLDCFKEGKAAEWLVKEKSLLNWFEGVFPERHFQMGGQGGIIANTLAICDVGRVFVHCASLPQEQAALFLQQENLIGFDVNGAPKPLSQTIRKSDTPLIHWIIEFDKNDSLTLEGQTFLCPKSNRFIATYDPSNFELAIDPHFEKGILTQEFDYVVLSGFQLLEEKLSHHQSGAARIAHAKNLLTKWRQRNPGCIIHLEFASTQDPVIRKHLLEDLAPMADSLGFNERELIDLLEVMNEGELAKQCEESLQSDILFEASQKVFERTRVSRLQLHMFGLYFTLQKKGARISPEANRRGMLIAAVLAGSKAKTGSLENRDNLLAAQHEAIKPKSLEEFERLAKVLEKTFGAKNFRETGIYEGESFDVIAIPSLIIDKPLTLVGMGDTISSLSLVGAH